MDADAFISNVIKDHKTGCLIWQGTCTAEGYGRLWIKRKGVAAHRHAWALAYGPIPEGMCVLHHCDNPPCVTPGHLFVGTRGDNNRDAVRKGRSRWAPDKSWKRKRAGVPSFRGERVPFSKLTREQVVAIRREGAAGEGPDAIANRYGISRFQARRILRLRSWRWLPSLSDLAAAP